MSIIKVEMEASGLAVLTLDDPDRSVNTLTPELLEEFQDTVLPLLDDPGVRAMALLSAKKDTFIAGADVKLFAGADDPDMISEVDGRYNRALTAIFRHPKPVTAGVHGAALGGGLEVALAATYIIASDDPATVLGLPEVLLGIMPAAGGTQRLPQRVGLLRGLPMLLAGQRVRAARALKLGLVDEVVPAGETAERARRAALDLAEGRLRPPRFKKSFTEKVISLPLARDYYFKKVRAQVERKTRGNMPGPLKIIACLEASLKQGEDKALEMEIAALGPLAVSPQSRSLVWLFLAADELKKPSEGEQAKKVERLAVLGAGELGAGAASVSLGRAQVMVLDDDSDALDECGETVRRGLDKLLRSGAVTAEERGRRFARFSVSKDYWRLFEADMVIEAAPEDLELKRSVMARAEKHLAAGAVYGVCVSTLGVGEICAGSAAPERVVGLVYGRPVVKSPLLELVVPAKTHAWAADTARALGRAQGKTVIQVTDSPGFYTTRLRTALFNEALALLAEGADIAALDGALLDFGFLQGPAAMMDAVGLERAARAARRLGRAFGGRWGLGGELLEKMLEAGLGGRAGGRGFYEYPQKPKGRKSPNPGVGKLLDEAVNRGLDGRYMQDCMALALVNEAAHCLQEGVISSPVDGDLGAVLGLGFAPFRAGPFHHVDAVGAGAVVARLEELAAARGPRFIPAGILSDHAQKGKKFFTA